MHRPPLLTRVLFTLVIAAIGLACATNPVTGKKQFTLTSESREIATGEHHYPIAIEAEGGELTTDPHLLPYVESVGQKVAAAGPRPDLPYAFAVTNTSKPHAFALPGGKIAVSRGLLVLLENEGQLASVLAHQVVHAAARHGTSALESDVLKRAAITTVAVGATAAGIPALPLLAMAGRSKSTTELLVYDTHAEDDEILADRHAMVAMRKAGYPPEDRLESLDLLVARQIDAGPNPRWQHDLFMSHPISRKRLAAARLYHWKLSEENPLPDLPKADSHAERYTERTRWLREIQYAYDTHDASREAYLEADYERAEQLSFQATDALPQEASFHALRGHILMKQGRYQDAFESYDRFVQLQPQNAIAWARRGLSRKALGDMPGAVSDFQVSHALRPNAISGRELMAWRMNQDPLAAEETSAARPLVRAQLNASPIEMGGMHIQWVPVEVPPLEDDTGLLKSEMPAAPSRPAHTDAASTGD